MITVLIPYFKNKEQLALCREALKVQTAKIDAVMTLDDSDYGNGFTATVNKGLKTLRNQAYAIILNQDCYLRPEATEKMIVFMDAHPKCAIAGIKQISSTNPDEIIHGGTLECFPAGRHKGGLVSRGDCGVSEQVPWVNGACMIVRLEAIFEFGLMDESMKMFCSDADWSYTARARGWECWYIAEAECVHEQGASKSRDDAMQKLFEADSIYFRDKWMTGELYKDLSLEVFGR